MEGTVSQNQQCWYHQEMCIFFPKSRFTRFNLVNLMTAAICFTNLFLFRRIWCILKSEHNCHGRKLRLFPRKNIRSIWKSFQPHSVFSPQTWIPVKNIHSSWRESLRGFLCETGRRWTLAVGWGCCKEWSGMGEVWISHSPWRLLGYKIK